MERLTLTSKVLYDVDYLAKTRELFALKKATARKLFYHGIDEDLRELNAHVIRCDCPKCLDMMGNNYPSSPRDTDELEEGDVFFASHDMNTSGNSMYGMLCMVVPEEDVNHAMLNGHRVKHLARLGGRSSSDCLLMEWFRHECQRHLLPRPEYHFGIRSFSLWIEQGHHGQKWSRTLEYGGYDPDFKSWRDIVHDMPYPEQVEKIYRGLMHTSIGETLAAHGRSSAVGCDEYYCSFESWFKVGDVSLLP